MAPMTPIERKALPNAIFTSGARSRERKVASASAAACSGTTGRCSSRNPLPVPAGAAAVAGEAAGLIRAGDCPPVSP